MRIGLYTGTALPTIGGQELVVDALARQFASLGHEPIVLAPRPSRPWRLGDHRLPYRVVRHPRFISMRRGVEWYGYFLRRFIRRQRPDVLHCHGLYPPGYLAGRSLAQLGCPMVLTSHGEDVYQDYPRLAEPRLLARHVEALAAADALVAISLFTREGYQRMLPAAKRIVDIPNGVDAQRWARPASPQADWQGRVPNDFLLFLGRLDRRKGVDVLLQALGQLHDPPVVVIAGDGPERPALEALAQRQGPSARTVFLGMVAGEEKAWLLQHARALVVPSRDWEAFGLVVLEAYAAGCPVVATRLAGLAGLVDPGRTGWLVEPGSVDELGAAIMEVLASPALSDSQRRLLQSKARQFDWPLVADRHLALYRSIS